MARGIKDLSNKLKDRISPSNRNKNKNHHGNNTYNKEESTTLHVIKSKLALNSLVELRLGFEDNEFYSKRDVRSLIKVIEEQFLYKLSLDKHSCLSSICIGWKLPPFALGPILLHLVPLLLQEPIKITHLQINLRNTPIPEDYLKRIVSWPTLECLDLRSMRVLQPIHRQDGGVSDSTTSSTAQNNHHHQYSCSGNDSTSDGILPHAVHYSPSSWKVENVVKIVPYISLSVRKLNLVDCGLRYNHIPELCEVIRRKMHGLQELSLRHNRDLNGGSDHLFALPCIKSLDLSLCDLDPQDGYYIGRAMEAHLFDADKNKSNENHHLKRLCLAGNYRMSEAIPEIVRLSASRLQELDCSFCDVQSKMQRKVFKALATSTNCTIQSFRMQGTRIGDVTELVNCIQNNISLRRLILDHPREPFYVSRAGMERVLDAMKLNYSISLLKLDTYRCEDLWQDMEFWLQLNRCGRKVLLQENKDQNISWVNVLEMGAKNDDVNVLYWLLKHGSVMFAS